MLKKTKQKNLMVLMAGILTLTGALAVILPRLSLSQASKDKAPVADVSDKSVEVDPAIPTSVVSCLPENARKIDLGGLIEKNDSQYYFLKAKFQNQEDFFEPLIEVKGQSCKLLNGELEQKAQSLTQFVDADTANALTVQAVKKVIADIGQEELEAELQKGVEAGKPAYLPREYVFAYQTLGVRLPENYKEFDEWPPKSADHEDLLD